MLTQRQTVKDMNIQSRPPEVVVIDALLGEKQKAENKVFETSAALARAQSALQAVNAAIHAAEMALERMKNR